MTTKLRASLLGICLAALVLSGCAPTFVVATVTPTSAATLTILPTAMAASPTQPQPTPTPPSPTPLPPAASPTPTQTSTPDPYFPYTIDYLSQRNYGGGDLEIVDVLAENSWFTRYLIRYQSDDLWVYGFLNVPVPDGPIGAGPYPIVIALHGYIDPAVYRTIDYTTGYADAITRAGYIVFHPNLRGYPPSDSGDNLFRVGMAVDVLNLIAILKSGEPVLPELANADPGRIGLWGHSMGGGVATRVITVSADVQAAVLYAAMSGDELQNFTAISRWSGGERGQEELEAPEDALQRISPVHYFDRIQAAVSIHHGRADELVPLAWSVETCNRMALLDLEVECRFYDNMPHTFFGTADQEFIESVIAFFNRVLKGSP